MNFWWMTGVAPLVVLERTTHDFEGALNLLGRCLGIELDGLALLQMRTSTDVLRIQTGHLGVCDGDDEAGAEAQFGGTQTDELHLAFVALHLDRVPHLEGLIKDD